MSDYPKTVYPPDGGTPKTIFTPDEYPDGWLEAPIAPMAAGGERVIGQPAEHAAPAPADVTHVAPQPTKKSSKK